MTKKRVAVYFDGFNMYHALSGLGSQHLKWLNLKKLSDLLISPRSETVVRVCYFSAFADHFKGTKQEPSLHRHYAYVAALEAKGVDFFPGNFSRKTLRFSSKKQYEARWERREEKQTDVAIGVQVVRDAFKDVFDKCLIVSCDTDMLPIFRLLHEEFPTKAKITVAPPKRPHHQTLIDIADDAISIKQSQIERALFGARVVSGGVVVAARPASYRPPRI